MKVMSIKRKLYLPIGCTSIRFRISQRSHKVTPGSACMIILIDNLWLKLAIDKMNRVRNDHILERGRIGQNVSKSVKYVKREVRGFPKCLRSPSYIKCKSVRFVTTSARNFFYLFSTSVLYTGDCFWTRTHIF